jgi:hypothetical protein
MYYSIAVAAGAGHPLCSKHIVTLNLVIPVFSILLDIY